MDLFLDGDTMGGAFNVFDGEDVVALFLGVARHVVEGFALSE